MSTTVAVERRILTDRLLACGLVAGPLFVVVFLLEGAFKGSGYDALRHDRPGEWLSARYAGHVRLHHLRCTA
jgi:hypothetical protein